jgi:catechol-2,3-dioxygenase
MKGAVMSTVTRPRLQHIALTVTDVEASLPWYEQIFDIRFMADVPHTGGVGKVLTDDTRSLMIVLHRHDRSDRLPFAETRTGLDHVGLFVPTRDDLESWQAHLEANGVTRSPAADKPCTQSPIADVPYGSVLVFRDPDNIQLELFSPPSV